MMTFTQRPGFSRTALFIVTGAILLLAIGCADKTGTPENKAQTQKRQTLIDQRKKQD